MPSPSSFVSSFRPALALSVLSMLALVVASAPSVLAEDWPEWRGAGRTGVWKEEGILEKFPEGGLNYLWRVPVRGGYAGPAVAEGRVFVTDFQATEGKKGTERALCLDAATGATNWIVEWAADYGALNYDVGPRATPTVDGERVYMLGATGVLRCLDVRTGEVLWGHDYVKDFGAELPIWGMACAPIVEGDLVVCIAAGEPDGKVMAFDKLTGAERWRALSSDWGPGYVQPIIVEEGGARQLIVWHPKAVSSLDPKTGEVYWEHPFTIKMDAPLAQPVWTEVDGRPALFVTAFYNGSLMLALDEKKPAATQLWKGTSDNEISTTALHACHVPPFIEGGHIYGVCSYGQFRCLNAATGERVWESFGPTMENKRWASTFLVKNGDRFFLNNDRGELIIARLSPAGYEEIDRTELIVPTTGGAGKRERGGVNWSHPAYANKRIYQRNDLEILCASLER